MTAEYTQTDNYGLNLYGDEDPADLRDGYNGSMHTIDKTLKNHLDRIDGVSSSTTAALKAQDVKIATNADILTALGATSVSASEAKSKQWDDASVKAGSPSRGKRWLRLARAWSCWLVSAPMTRRLSAEAGSGAH